MGAANTARAVSYNRVVTVIRKTAKHAELEIPREQSCWRMIGVYVGGICHVLEARVWRPTVSYSIRSNLPAVIAARFNVSDVEV